MHNVIQYIELSTLQTTRAKRGALGPIRNCKTVGKKSPKTEKKGSKPKNRSNNEPKQ